MPGNDGRPGQYGVPGAKGDAADELDTLVLIGDYGYVDINI